MPSQSPRHGHAKTPTSRRDFFHQAGGGLGALAALWLLEQESAASAAASNGPRAGHFPAKARSVIYLFMHGGPSHLETFDPKPDLQRLAGQPLPASFGPSPRGGKWRITRCSPPGEPSASAARAASRSPISFPTCATAPTTSP